MILPELNSISLDITSRCNLQCSFCRNKDVLSNKELERNFIVKILDDAFQYESLKRIHFTGGEPTLHPDFIELCRIVKSREKIALSVSSNGYDLSMNLLHDLADLGIDALSISLNGNEGTQNKLTGRQNSYSRLRQNITTINENSISYGIRTTLTPQNIGQMQSIVEFCE